LEEYGGGFVVFVVWFADEFVGLSNCQKNERTQTENTRESLPVVSSVTEINSSLSHPPNQPNPDRRQPSKFQQLVVFIIIIIIIVAKTTGNNISSLSLETSSRVGPRKDYCSKTILSFFLS
jgi:hypothetical protein